VLATSPRAHRARERTRVNGSFDNTRRPAHYPPTPAELARLAGYVRDLHQREPNVLTCLVCTRAWPCRGAKRQIAMAREIAREWWYLDESFTQATMDAAHNKGARQSRKQGLPMP